MAIGNLAPRRWVGARRYSPVQVDQMYHVRRNEVDDGHVAVEAAIADE